MFLPTIALLHESVIEEHPGELYVLCNCSAGRDMSIEVRMLRPKGKQKCPVTNIFPLKICSFLNFLHLKGWFFRKVHI